MNVVFNIETPWPINNTNLIEHKTMIDDKRGSFER